MNRQTKRMMAKQGTDKPRARRAQRRPAAAAHASANAPARGSTSPRSGASCEGRLADHARGHQLHDRRADRRHRHDRADLRLRLRARPSSSSSSSTDVHR